MKKLINAFKTKIRLKLFLSVIIVMVAFFTFISVFSTPILFRVFTHKTYDTMCSVANSVDMLVPETGTYYLSIYSLAASNNVTIEVVSNDGYLEYTTANSSSAQDSNHFASSGSTTPTVNRMKKADTSYGRFNYDSFETKTLTSANSDYFVYSRDNDFGQTIYIFSPVANVKDIVTASGAVYSAFSIGMVLVMIIVLLILTARLTRPVEEMNNVTKQMASLNFSGKCKDYGNDEVGELGKSINSLSDSLDSTLKDLQVKNTQLEKDIELRLALDNARKSFISNVSHELKTPISIISGYAEGLGEGIVNDPETIKDYCKIINDESQKMNSLVLELLELSKLESRTEPFTPDYFNLGSLIVSLLEHLFLQLEQNNIKIENNIPSELCCFGQCNKIEIVLKNFITNAVSHCDNEKIIRLRYEDCGSTYKINVFNTGKSISEEDLPNIWTSFYRADKSHMRKENRYGLGLSIVKSIMNNHQCEFGAENLDSGVNFYFFIPKDKDFYD